MKDNNKNELNADVESRHAKATFFSNSFFFFIQCYKMISVQPLVW